jgi:hypothetical protein
MNLNHRPFHFCALALPFSVLLIATSRLSAGTLTSSQLPTITMQVVGATEPWAYPTSTSQYHAATNADGGYELNAALDAYGVCDGNVNIKIDQLQFNSDPFVLNNILVTNTTASTQIFSVTVGLPTTFAAPNLISGTITTSVIDGDASGAATVSTVNSVGQSIYKAQIDSGNVASLQNNPFSVSTPGSNSSTASFGPIANLIAVNSSIGIQLTFQLTAGDTAAILSRFDVAAVPEPASLILCGCALLVCLAGYRRAR